MLSFSIKRYVGLVIIAIVIAVAIIFILRPELLNKIWLWAVGFSGALVGLGERVVSFIKSGFSSQEKSSQNSISSVKKADTATNNNELLLRETAHKKEVSDLQSKIATLEKELSEKSIINPDVTDAFIGTTISVLRFQDDGETTLGILFVNNRFFCYTLEDTYRQQKVKGETRIPSGTYNVDFRKEVTILTQKYRIPSRPWFDYHLEIQNVKNFAGVYIHIGNNKDNTEGCLLIADGITSTDTQKMLSYSTAAYERFYKLISNKLKSGDKVRIKIFDESWFEHFKIK